INTRFQMITSLPSGPAPAGSFDPPANIQMQLYGKSVALTQPSTVKVLSFNQVPGANFQVFYREQANNYVLPGIDNAALSGTGEYTVGRPQAGLTNYQNWNQYGLAFAGGLAPADASAWRSDINGLVGAIQSTQGIAPKVVLVTPWDGAQVSWIPPLRIRYN